MKANAMLMLGVAAALAATGCVSRPGMASDQRCPWPEPVVATAPRAVPAHLFANIDTTWTLARIFARLGPARAEVGSGAYTYDWVADDGRVFVAAASSRCGLVRRASFVDAPPPGS
jgi:hypothetical protein